MAQRRSVERLIAEYGDARLTDLLVALANCEQGALGLDS
jgi:hypothetical protein